MAFDDLLKQVGAMGRFQFLHIIFLNVPVLLMASHNLLQIFVAMVPPHHCSTHNLSEFDLRLEQKLLITVPLDGTGKPYRCQRYVIPQWHFLMKNETLSKEEKDDNKESASIGLQGCIDGWSYNMTDRNSTIISEWDLVCELRPLKEMGQTIYMGGVLVGALIFGGLGDRYGRWIPLLVSNMLMAVCGTCVAFSTSFNLYCIFRFGCGMALSGIGLNTFSLTLEWIPIKVRTVVGTSMGYCYTVGQLILVAIAYFVRDWRWLTLAVSLPFYVFFLFAWWYHESARWLVMNNNSEKAIKKLKSVARINGRKEEAEKIDIHMLEESMKREILGSQGTYSFVDLFRTSSMRRITICMSAVWLSTSFAYYGLAMDLQKFGVDIYLIQLIFGAIDIPAKVIITVTMAFCGRRCSQSGALIVAGVTILCNLLVPYNEQLIQTCLAVIGKGCLAASFNCCFLYTGEMYPTIIRQNGMGWASMMARVGAMVAPMVLLLGDNIPWLPGVIYGGAPIISGVAAMFLPETLGLPLPDTVQDVEERGLGRHSNDPPKEAIVLQDVQGNLLKSAA